MHIDACKTIDEVLEGALDRSMFGSTHKSAFEDRFETELARLGRLAQELTRWEEENLLSALGAAAIGEYELACAFVEAVRQVPPPSPPRGRRRRPISIVALRRRFERVRGAAR